MKVILKEDVKALGAIGEVVDVKPGYARNFLIPKNFAIEASIDSLRMLEHEKRVMADRGRKVSANNKSVADRISALSLTIKAKAGDEEKLFGSVTSMDIAEAAKAQGVDIDKRKIDLADPIKRLGEYSIDVKVAHDITASLRIQVVPE